MTTPAPHPLPTAPHRARPVLAYANEDRREEFVRTALSGFYVDFALETWTTWLAANEPDRSFGFEVDGRWISTCSAFSRQLMVPGGTVPVGAVTLVTVNPSYRRQGLLRQMMEHQLADVHRRREPVALLWASEAQIYGRYGYGSTAPRLRLSGRTRDTAFLPGVDLGEGSVGQVDAETAAPVLRQLHARWLPDRPGALDRSEVWWQHKFADPEAWRDGATAYRYALHFDGAGEPDGYVMFRVKETSDHDAEVQVVELDAGSPTAYARLWRFVLDLDLVQSFTRRDAPADDPLRQLLLNQRAASAELQDATYARLVHVPRALEARRYATDLDVVVGVSDPLLAHNDGTFRLQGGLDGAAVTKSRRRPDLSLSVRDLGAVYLGGTPLGALHRAGLVTERTPGAVAATAAAFSWPRPAFCPDNF